MHIMGFDDTFLMSPWIGMGIRALPVQKLCDYGVALNAV